MMNRLSTLVLAFAFFLAGCSDALVNSPSASEDALGKRDRAAGQQTLTVVETALAVNADTGEFSTLIAALSYAGLVGAVDAFDQVTVFAPTDAAFAAIGLDADNVDDVFAGDDGKAALTNILLYHLKEGRQFSKPVLNKKQIEMANGGFTYPDASVPALVDANGGVAPFVGGGIDVPARNGVIHIIGAVLLP
jgi:uncharacterized surface protein with fasciclin (FAS1) repeats